MTFSDLDLATMLLQHLRRWGSLEPLYKFNVIGRDESSGNLEAVLRIVLSAQDRHTLLWIWSLFERNRLLDIAHGDGWAILSERGRLLQEAELKQIVASPHQPPSPAERQFDPLLGIPNRGEYDRTLPLLADGANSNHPLSLVVIDIDHFKVFNDQYGHHTGDIVLKDVATAVSQAIAGKGEAFRYGGEEIVVLLPNHSIGEAEGVAERIRHTIEIIKSADLEIGVTGSLGVSTLPTIAKNAEELFQQADAAMYNSKRTGRNRVTCASLDDPQAPDGRQVRRTVKADNLSVRLKLKQGSRTKYVLEVHNTCTVEVEIKQISLEQNGIALMDPVRPESDAPWTVSAGGKKEVEWNPAPNPAASLTRLHPNEGIQFRADIEFVVILSSAGIERENRQKLAVNVLVINSELRQLAG